MTNFLHADTPADFYVTGSDGHYIVVWRRAGSRGKITNHGPDDKGWPTREAAIDSATRWAAGYGVTITGWNLTGQTSYAIVELPPDLP